MQRLHLTLATPAENIALDEALLDWAEDDGPTWEFVRIWESPQPIAVVGRSSRVSQEVNLPACRARGIPILRRSSGGAAIVAGPGCLMYAVVLSYQLRPELRDIGRAHAFVLERLADALQSVAGDSKKVMHVGTSDLAISPRRPGASQSAIQNPHSEFRKFSGNSLRAKRTHLLYHGTLLYDFDLSLIQTCLRMPPRQPDYRAARPHSEFIANLPLARETLLDVLASAWPASGELTDWPQERTANLVVERFSRDEWNLEFA